MRRACSRRPGSLARGVLVAKAYLVLVAAASLAIAIGSANAAHADDASLRPVLQVEVEPRRVVVGQAATLRITLLAPSWMPRPPEYPALELANAVIRLPPDSSYPTSELRDGETWSGIVREYVFQPLQAGRFRIAGEKLGVTYADPETSQPVRVELRMPTIELRAFVPEGAEGLDPFLSGRSLEISQSLEGNVEDLVAGSAIKRVLTVRIDGMAAMFLPPLFESETRSGLAIYSGTASVENDGTIGIREEAATYVFERSGDYSLSPIELAYWNVESEQVETASVEGIDVSVRGGGLASGAGGAESSLASRVPWGWIGVAVILAFVAYRLRRLPALAVDRVRAWRARVEASEGFAWRRLMAALRRGEAKAVLRRFIEWDAHPELLPARREDSEGAMRSLREAAFGNVVEAEAGGALSSELRRSLRTLLGADRRARRRMGDGGEAGRLPPLNPVSTIQ